MHKPTQIACLLLMPALASPGTAAALAADRPLPRAGDRVDLGAFARPLPAGEGRGIEWDMLHDIAEVRVEGVDAAAAPALRLEWWGSVWPANGTGGWKKLDDPWNGKWVRFAPAPAAEGGSLVFRFSPLAQPEWENALTADKYDDKKLPAFRRTLKLRLVTAEGKPGPASARISAFGGSRWAEDEFNVEFRHTGDGTVCGRVEVVNGILAAIASLPAPRDVLLEGQGWRAARPAGMASGVTLRVCYVENRDRDSNDLTRVTVRLGEKPDSTGFSFVPQDVLADTAMRLPSLGVLVSAASRHLSLANDRGPGPGNWDLPVRLRLTQKPEMTRAMAMQNIPRLSPLPWVPLGLPSARQEFFVSAAGDWSVWSESLHTRDPKEVRDWGRLLFRRNVPDARHDRLNGSFDTREEPRFDERGHDNRVRYLEEGCLPLMHAEWDTGAIHYHHALIATTLEGEYADDVKRRGDETAVLLTRMEITNTGAQVRPAFLNLRYSQNAPIALRDDGIIAITDNTPGKVPAGLTALRGQISMGKPAGGGAAGWTVVPGAEPQCSSVLRYRTSLEPGQTQVIYFKTPYVDALDAGELARFRSISFEHETPAILEYWRGRLARGMAIDTPDPAVNDFYRANLWHIIITTDRDPRTGLYNQGVGTVGYRVFGNETVMIARMMDMRGEHTEARRFVEPLLRYQGDIPLKGRFSTKEGAFHSAGKDYTHGEYAMNHGFVLWGIGDHYFMTRDKAYLQEVAPRVVKGCDFLISERKSTMGKPGEPRPPMHGMTPASSLEDVVEYQYWFAVNGYFYLGMKRAAQALAAIGHPEAARLTAEAEAYRRDIEINMREAITQAAAARLRDGNWIPYVPSRVWHWRHLTEGWIREALYPSLQLATAEVVTPSDPLVTWMLDELEDNIYFSWQSGIHVPDYEKTWFGKGALTLQPCLVDLAPIYMARDEVPAALRSFWNSYAFSIFPEVCCFTEWAKDWGRPGGPLYKTSDEARWVMWLRQLLLWEDGDRLWFGRGMPAEWLGNGKTLRVADARTFFGTAAFSTRSRIDAGRIEASVTVPDRNPPAEAWLRLRHPEGKTPIRVFVNNQLWPTDRISGQDIRIWPADGFAAGKPISVVAEYPYGQ